MHRDTCQPAGGAARSENRRSCLLGTTPGEVGPLIGELLGRPEVGLDLAGLDGRSDVDLVFVSSPVDGLEREATFLTGQVVLSPDMRSAELAQAPSVDQLLVQRFQEARCWATAVVAGPMDWATTSKALRLIDCGLAWLMVVHSHWPVDLARSHRASVRPAVGP